ncbi:sulfatase-like hydrolase/transferase [bacterium]|nr:sulfatase-like hydrolase/transferase [candidate division CSSED10-310 bacterium]
MRIRRAGWLLPFMFFIGTWCGGSASDQKNVLLITIDALRYDHCGCYGYERPTTPCIDSLASRGIVFDQVIVPIPRTVQALATLVTSLDPLDHGVLSLGNRLDDKIQTLADIFFSAGYSTAAIVEHPMQIVETGDNGANLGKGFKRILRTNRPAIEAMKWLKKTPGSFFLWIHLFDPHWKYLPPADCRIFSDPGYNHLRYVKLLKKPKGRIVYQNDWSPSDIRYAVDLYDGEILSADRKVKRLMDSLDPARKTDTYVAVLADHGEGLGEHDYYFDHGEDLHDEIIRIPWVLAGPGMDIIRKRYRHQVSIADVAPTLLDLAGLPVPDTFSGVNLVSRIHAGHEELQPPHPYICGLSDISRIPQNPHAFMSENRGRQRFVRTEKWKLIVIPERDGPEEMMLYDLELDPTERLNRASSNPERVKHLLEKIREFLESHGRWASFLNNSERPMDTDDIKALKSLGYIN